MTNPFKDLTWFKLWLGYVPLQPKGIKTTVLGGDMFIFPLHGHTIFPLPFKISCDTTSRLYCCISEPPSGLTFDLRWCDRERLPWPLSRLLPLVSVWCSVAKWPSLKNFQDGAHRATPSTPLIEAFSFHWTVCGSSWTILISHWAPTMGCRR